jgi:hypothetical protein
MSRQSPRAFNHLQNFILTNLSHDRLEIRRTTSLSQLVEVLLLGQMLKYFIISEYSILSLDDLHFVGGRKDDRLRCHNPEEPMAGFETIITLI